MRDGQRVNDFIVESSLADANSNWHEKRSFKKNLNGNV